MPTYEYKCKKCGHQFEEFQSITDEPLKTCPKHDCNGIVYRIISPGAGFLFKGSGFYQTDYRSESYKQAAAKETAGPSSSSSDKGKSDSKSEAAKGSAKKASDTKSTSSKKES